MSASASMTKCVILARGLGTRMRCNDADSLLDAAQASAADSGIKAMVPIGRPFLDYVLSVLVGAGFQRACLVIGPEHNLVRDYYTREQRPTRIEVSFAVQSEALGTANAVLAAEQFAGTDEFLAINSDNYYPIDSLRQIQDLRAPGTVLFQAAELLRQGNIPEDRIRAFAYCVVDRDGFLADIVEKPDTAANFRRDKLISMNCWRFDSRVFPACREVPISSRGEYELPAAVKLAIHGGAKFRVAISHDGVLDLSRRSDIASVAERLKNVRVDL